jgi:quercetin dioxygenase-like cupin family protein
MKKSIIITFCTLSFAAFAIEPEVQFENDQLSATKIKIMAHEELPFHRYEYPQIVVAIKGGTITRVEADGRTTEVNFPKGQAVYLPVDPPNELHKSINNSCKPLELIIIQLKNAV